jgi:hypothetical protein
LLKSGTLFSWGWFRAGQEVASIGALVYQGKVILSYRYRSRVGAEWEEVKEPVSLEWSACNFGGERPWFVCPGAQCGRRVAILYKLRKDFLCQHCCQREDNKDRALRRAQKIRQRLGEART